MKKNIMLGSLAFSALLIFVFWATGYGAVLAYALIGLLVSFICAMSTLTDKPSRPVE